RRRGEVARDRDGSGPPGPRLPRVRSCRASPLRQPEPGSTFVGQDTRSASPVLPASSDTARRVRARGRSNLSPPRPRSGPQWTLRTGTGSRYRPPLSPVRWNQLLQQFYDVGADAVADGPHRLDPLACGVGQVPVQVALAWEERAGVAAPHGDHHV